MSSMSGSDDMDMSSDDGHNGAAVSSMAMPETVANKRKMEDGDDDDDDDDTTIVKKAKVDTMETTTAQDNMGAIASTEDKMHSTTAVLDTMTITTVTPATISAIPATQTDAFQGPGRKVPPAVWQRIFMLLPPAMLFRCTRVCMSFKHILENVKSGPVRKRYDRRAPILDSENVWTISRRATYPSLPRPLQHLKESQMLRLITQQTCQSCHKRFSPVKAENALNGGPGENGVRTIWQFGTTVCAPCLKQHSLTDVDLLKERTEMPPGSLRRGLPYAFLHKGLHVIDEKTARQHGGQAGQAITKIYWRPDITKVVAQFKDAQVYGTGAAEEWIKGLDDMGKDAMNDAARWARWEEQVILGKSLAAHMRELDPVTFPPQQKQAWFVDLNPDPGAITHPLPPPVLAASLKPEAPPPLAHEPHRLAVNHTQSRPIRSPREVEEARRLRAEDIQRRCMQLEPPLLPDALQYCEAYIASMAITTPLTEQTWAQLRPRIEKDRYHAERAHYEQSQHLAILRAGLQTVDPYHSYHDAAQKEKEDHEWALARGSLREKLGEYADDYINGRWRGAADLTAQSALVFVTEVLIEVYERYNADVKDEPNPTLLVLDDLKWLFNTKVRPHAEPHTAPRHEIFLCAECYQEGEYKWLALESLIQHYGAKHTKEFSKDNITVHWQSALWPSTQPFLRNAAKCVKNERRRPTRHVDNHQLPQSRSGDNNVSKDGHEHIPPIEDEDDQFLATSDLARAWTSLGGVADLMSSIRVHTALQVTAQQFHQKTKKDLSIELFTKVLAVNGGDLNEFKNVRELMCRHCQPDGANNPPVPYYTRASMKKLFTVSGLLTHWHLTHKGEFVRTRDGQWKKVIDLPERSQILALMQAEGMDDNKLQMIADAIPSTFPQPLPTIGTIKLGPDSGLASRLVKNFLNKGANKSKKKKGQHNANGNQNAAKAGEYDPHNPMLAKKDKPIDPRMFDTELEVPEIIRKDQVVASKAQKAAEATAAINQLQQSLITPQAVQPQQQKPLPLPLPSPYAATAKPVIADIRTEKPEQPNIAEIIANLQRNGLMASNAQPPVPAAYTPPQYAQPASHQECSHYMNVPATLPSGPPIAWHQSQGYVQASKPTASAWTPPQYAQQPSYQEYASYSNVPSALPAESATAWSQDQGYGRSASVYTAPANPSYNTQPMYTTPVPQPMYASPAPLQAYSTLAPQSARAQTVPAQQGGQDLVASLTRNMHVAQTAGQVNAAHYGGAAQQYVQPEYQYAQGQQAQPGFEYQHSARQGTMQPGQGYPSLAPAQTQSSAPGAVRYVDEYGRDVWMLHSD